MYCRYFSLVCSFSSKALGTTGLFIAYNGQRGKNSLNEHMFSSSAKGTSHTEHLTCTVFWPWPETLDLNGCMLWLKHMTAHNVFTLLLYRPLGNVTLYVSYLSLDGWCCTREVKIKTLI
jgi:hypothetical protein